MADFQCDPGKGMSLIQTHVAALAAPGSRRVADGRRPCQEGESARGQGDRPVTGATSPPRSPDGHAPWPRRAATDAARPAASATRSVRLGEGASSTSGSSLSRTRRPVSTVVPCLEKARDGKAMRARSPAAGPQPAEQPIIRQRRQRHDRDQSPGLGQGVEGGDKMGFEIGEGRIAGGRVEGARVRTGGPGHVGRRGATASPPGRGRPVAPLAPARSR